MHSRKQMLNSGLGCGAVILVKPLVGPKETMIRAASGFPIKNLPPATRKVGTCNLELCHHGRVISPRLRIQSAARWGQVVTRSLVGRKP
jgi:hypothetical protein